MPAGPNTSRATLVVVALLVGSLGLFASLWRATPALETRDSAPAMGQPRAGAGELESVLPPSAEPASPPTAGCAQRAERQCHSGDLWWFDGCGAPEELAESCGGRACAAGSCSPAAAPRARCNQLSAYGLCEGERALACIDGQIVGVDCSAKGQRCVQTREGARCLPRDPERGCSAGDRARCVGDRLRQCVDGRWAEIDCAARRGSCTSAGDGARCVSTTPAAVLPNFLPELCNDRDDDRDGKIDEDAVCEPVPLLAFVPEAARLTDFEARMAGELEILNRAFAPLEFRWAPPVSVSAAYRVIDPEQLDPVAYSLSKLQRGVGRRAAESAAPAQAGLAFYIPVLFTEQLRSDPPKAGISSLPNAHCGGVRISDDPSPAYGVIVLADKRMPETLSHELGHYLGLCHTHDELDRIGGVARELPACKRDGDGICDTPFDPGPESCYERGTCDFFCPARSARPDSTNLMSYYMACRAALTPEQLIEVTRGLALRRGWFRCLERQDCPCQPSQADTCPAQMSCHGTVGAFSCELDGPVLPNATCQASNQCSQSSACLAVEGAASGQCVRYCAGQADCTCLDIGLSFQICREDLPAL